MRAVAGLAAAVAVLVGAAARHPGAPARLPTPGARGGRAPEPPRWAGALAADLGPTVDPVALWHSGRALAGALVAAVLLTVGPVAVVVLAAVGAASTPLLRRELLRRRQVRRDRQLAEWLERVATAVRGHQSLTEAVVAASHDAPAPLGGELAAVTARLHHGAPLRAALAPWANGPTSSNDVALTVTALTLAAEAGGDVSRAIDAVAATLRERRALAVEVQALATQAQASAGLLAVAPLVFTGVVVSVEPQVADFLFRSPPGLACLTAGGALEALGAVWMRRIVSEAA